MTILNAENTLVLMIDVQEKLLNSVFNKDVCESKAKIISGAASILEIPVIVTEQYPKGLGNTVVSVKENLDDINSKFYEKLTFSALDNSEVFNAVKNVGKNQIVIFGIETHICVSQTAAALVNAGYEVFVVKDACGSRAEAEYLAGLERMKDNGVQVVTAEIVLFEWLKGAKNPKFKEVQALIK